MLKVTLGPETVAVTADAVEPTNPSLRRHQTRARASRLSSSPSLAIPAFERPLSSAFRKDRLWPTAGLPTRGGKQSLGGACDPV